MSALSRRTFIKNCAGSAAAITFPNIALGSPNIVEIKITKRGKVRRAKLYYLRDLVGKKARIKEKKFIKPS